ncbi:MAG: N-6 DNA methylase [Actinomycetota bacterium]|nr:N-6 DNA methylase [Actinomycetota bacterium]
MARRDPNPFVSITSVGGLLPIALLERLATEPDTLPATGPNDYELLPGQQLRTVINRAWNDLRGPWTALRQRLAATGDNDPAVGLTREKWVLPLLRELGWAGVEPANGTGTLYAEQPTPAGSQRREWPITHEWPGRVPLHLLGWNVNLDTRTPGVRGAASAAPHAILQDFLNASSDYLWGMVTNGLKLRILRDSTSLTRQAYLEFDLEVMFDHDVFTDFILLWMICHRTRFPSASNRVGILETWQDTAHDQGVRALEQLREGVTAGIEALGTGLLAHPANSDLRAALHAGTLDRNDLYRQLLRVVYRLVFLFVVEDRDLLHPPDADRELRGLYEEHYSTARLREQARRHRGGHHPDGWQQLNLLLDGLARPEGIPQLGLPSLAGGLFDPDSTAALADTRMANHHLYRAVRSLAYTQRSGLLHRVDFRNLGSEELGSVYESLLEFHPKIDPDARTLTLESAAGHERKTTGAYYTPTSLIAQILDDALDPVIEEATAGKNPEQAEQAILGLTVCDPACGSAHFLVAAAHRLAKRLATARTGDPEPTPMAIQQALRDVVGRCIYGVDVNPMSLELAKVSLWLECHVPGRPLTFLDHHLKRGNSLLGIHHPDLIAWNPDAAKAAEQRGIPDAAFAPLHGDDRSAVNQAKKHNRTLRGQGRQTVLAFGEPELDEQAAVRRLADRANDVNAMGDRTLSDLAAKRKAWLAFEESDEGRRLRLQADAWCATFTCPKTEDALRQRSQQPWDVYYATASGQDLPEDNAGVRATRREASRHRFFHWFLEFPDTHAAGGFSVMIGNPPWEKTKLYEKEWFAPRAPEIAETGNKAARERLIRELYEAPPGSPQRELATAWDEAQHAAAAESHFLRNSGAYPLGGVGDINTFAVFADLFRQLISPSGQAGFICPTGLAVGETYANFFGHLVNTRTITSFYSFENEDLLFPAVTNKTKFALVILSGPDRPVDSIAFTGYVRQATQIHDPERHYELKPGDIAAINPNTLTAPLFRYARDADVTATIHRNAPVLVRDDDAHGDPWGIDYLRMFDMTNDSHLFVSYEEAIGRGGQLEGGVFVLPGGSRLLPLYEGKMIWHYDHRYGTYEGQTQKQANKGVLPHVTDEQHADPDFTILPRYWVDEKLVEEVLVDRWDRGWMIGFRDVGPSERTMVCSLLPHVGAGNPTPLLLSEQSPIRVAFLYADLASIPVDFALRQKSSRMSLYVVKQAPILKPPAETHTCPWSGDETLLGFVASRVVELSYTAQDLAAFADDCGYAGPPFCWEPDRRAVLQAELDALFFHLYGLDGDDVDWVLDTFTVLRKYEERPPERGGYGEYRTKRLVLDRYDAMARAIHSGLPYETPLAVPPADDEMRHPA